MLDGSDSGEINALAISKQGEHFVSGGEDKRIKLWDYDEGICYYSGVGHSGSISKVTLNLNLNFHRLRSLLIKNSLSVSVVKEPSSFGTPLRRYSTNMLEQNSNFFALMLEFY
jgi:WD40 repeat protein